MRDSLERDCLAAGLGKPLCAWGFKQEACNEHFEWSGAMGEGAECPSCGTTDKVRPDIVWFGEMPYEMERIEEALQRCDLFVSIGTSGAVYPAAGFVQTARYCGAKSLEMNLEPSLGSIFFDESRTGRAGELVPPWVEEMLASLPCKGGD